MTHRDGVLALWAWLPLQVLAVRQVGGQVEPADAVAPAEPLLAALAGGALSGRLPAVPPSGWRQPLPAPAGWRRLDEVPAAEVVQVVKSGMSAFRAAAPGAANVNRLGDALLDHAALTVSTGDIEVAVQLRVLVALVRMGFLRHGTQVAVSVTPAWARFDAEYGSVYRRRQPPLPLLRAPS